MLLSNLSGLGAGLSVLHGVDYSLQVKWLGDTMPFTSQLLLLLSRKGAVTSLPHYLFVSCYTGIGKLVTKTRNYAPLRVTVLLRLRPKSVYLRTRLARSWSFVGEFTQAFTRWRSGWGRRHPKGCRLCFSPSLHQRRRWLHRKST